MQKYHHEASCKDMRMARVTFNLKSSRVEYVIRSEKKKNQTLLAPETTLN